MALAIGGDHGEGQTRSRLGRVTLLLFLLAVALLGLVVLRAYQARTTEVTLQEVPVLKAESGPTRERPVEPGGMQVPHGGSAVFTDLEGGNEPVVERLLPPPEVPMPKPVAVVKMQGGIPLPPAMPDSIAPAQAETEVAAVPPKLTETPPIVEAPKATEVPKTAEVSKIPEAPKIPAEPKLTGGTPPEASTALSAPNEPPGPGTPTTEMALTAQLPAIANPVDGYRVQLGSYRESGKASKAWEMALASAPKLLAPVNHFVFQADLGAGKGVFYRLQAGPLPSRDSADSLCKQLKVKKVDCYVVSP